MWWFLLAWSASAMTVDEAVEAAATRAPSLQVSEARVVEAEARLREVRGRLMPNVSVNGALVGQTEIQVDLADKIPLPVEVDPLQVMPGAQVQGGAQLFQPVVAPAAWAGQRSARSGVEVARGLIDADRQRLTQGVVAAFHASAEAHAMLEDAQRAEDLAARLLEKGRVLADLGAVSPDQVLPFERAHATARSNLALARVGVSTADGLLATLTGIAEPAEVGATPTEVPALQDVLARMDRPDLRAASLQADAASSMVGVERAGLYPTVGLQAGLVAMTPAPDFGRELTWRVSLGATVPLFQGGTVASRVDQAQARVSQARAGATALRELAELDVRRAHGSLAQAVAALEERELAVDIAQRAVVAAERRLDEGGGSLLQLQQAQIELIAAEASRTRARSASARASDTLRLAVDGGL